jgi:hypothetical protein
MALLRCWLKCFFYQLIAATAAALNDGLWDGGPDANRDMCVAD